MSIALSSQSTPNSRLKRARLEAGYSSAADFARAHSIKMTTYQHHENGRRDLKPEIAKAYARFLKVPAGTLLYGEQLHVIAEVPVVGVVTSAGMVEFNATAGLPGVMAILPDPGTMVGLKIVGDALAPAYRDGDVVFHRALSRDRYNPSLLHGLECVVELVDGSKLLRQVSVQPNGNMTLIAHNAPALFNQQVVSAAPVEVVQRYLPRTLID